MIFRVFDLWSHRCYHHPEHRSNLMGFGERKRERERGHESQIPTSTFQTKQHIQRGPSTLPPLPAQPPEYYYTELLFDLTTPPLFFFFFFSRKRTHARTHARTRAACTIGSSSSIKMSDEARGGGGGEGVSTQIHQFYTVSGEPTTGTATHFAQVPQEGIAFYFPVMHEQREAMFFSCPSISRRVRLTTCACCWAGRAGAAAACVRACVGEGGREGGREALSAMAEEGGIM